MGCLHEKRQKLGLGGTGEGSGTGLVRDGDGTVGNEFLQDSKELAKVLEEDGITSVFRKKAVQFWNGGKTSYGKSSGKLNWDTVVGKRGETRKAHVVLHEVNDLSKPSHGVFYGDSVSTINKAWDNRANGYMLSEGNTDLYVIPYQNAGFSGGYGGQGNNLIMLLLLHKREPII